MLRGMPTAARMVSIRQRDAARWECDCVCGWKTTDRMRFAREEAAQRAATLHLRICTMLHP
jgi:hypothetical protein